MKDYFYHYTFNSGHIHKSGINEYNPEIYFTMNNFLEQNLAKDGAKLDLMGDRFKYHVKTSITEEGFMISLAYYSKKEYCKIPILEIAGSINSQEPFNLLKNAASKISSMSTVIKDIKLPYVVDFILPSSINYAMEAGGPSSMLWTADFARCMAWTIFKGKIS